LDERLENEIIVVDLSRGVYYSLREDLADFWSRCVEQKTPLTTEEDLNFASLLFVNHLILMDRSFRPISLIEVNPMLSKFTDLEDLLLADPIHDLGPEH